MHKFILVAGMIMAGLAVGIGAFGAHGLKEVLTENQRMETFETGVKYHFYHALGMILIGILMFHISNPLLGKAGLALFIGILIFSVSLYVLSLTNIKWLGAITPIGGLAFLIGWGMCAWAVLKAEW
ncbi:MAG: DUF423 domain-containing protein [Flammeovirgaceae bacterium]